MLIVHLITTLDTAGAECQLQQLIKASHTEDLRHVVISLAPVGIVGLELESCGFEVYSLGMRARSLSPLGIMRLLHLLRRLKPDIVQCWLYHACLMGFLATRIVRTRAVVWTLRSANQTLRDYSLPLRTIVWICSRVSGRVDAILVNSQTAKTVHEKWGYKAGKMRVVPNGIDGSRFSPNLQARASVRKELGIPNDSVLIGMVARFHPVKDHETFLRAASLLRLQLPNMRIVLAGAGIDPGNSALMRLVQRNGLHEVTHLLGVRRDVAGLTAALDLACLSSRSESFPNVVAEAMACGVPCVVTDAGDSATIVGNEGKVVPPQNPSRFAAAILELAALTPAQKEILGQSARDRILQEFSVQRMVRAYEQVFRELADPPEPILRADSQAGAEPDPHV